MDCAVNYSEAALADLEQITAFIATDNAEVAERFANRLVDLAESLRSMPERGRPVKRWPGVRVVVGTDAATGELLSCPFAPKAVLFCGLGDFGGWLGD